MILTDSSLEAPPPSCPPAAPIRPQLPPTAPSPQPPPAVPSGALSVPIPKPGLVDDCKLKTLNELHGRQTPAG